MESTAIKTERTVTVQEFWRNFRVGMKVRWGSIDGIIGEISDYGGEASVFFWSNSIERDGSRGGISPGTKGYKYSWVWRSYDADRIEIIGNEMNFDPEEDIKYMLWIRTEFQDQIRIERFATEEEAKNRMKALYSEDPKTLSRDAWIVEIASKKKIKFETNIIGL